LKPGSGTPDELIASTDDGIWMETNRSWSIDDRRYQFQFSTEIGWEIKGGKKVRMLKNPSYSESPQNSGIRAMAFAAKNSGRYGARRIAAKGQPMQTMGTGHGAAPARFLNVKMGTAFSGH
jgi:TldD protein